MLILYFALASLLVGWVRGGRLRNLEHTPLAGLWLPILAFLLEALIGPLGRWLPGQAALWLLVPAEYLLLGLFLWRNRALAPTRLLAAGTLCNLLVIGANGWRMPVSARIASMPELSALADRVRSGELTEYVLADGSTRLLWLADVIHLPFVPGMSFASVGDLLLGAGIFWLIQRIMVVPANP